MQWLVVLLSALFIVSCKNNNEKKNEEESSSIGQQEQVEIKEKIKEITPLSFTYEAPRPLNGKLKGVVELGASGFNSFVVDIDSEKRWDLKDAKFGVSDIYENTATEATIKKGLRDYINGMIKEGVSGKDIHFIVSSGAKKEDATKKIINALESMGYVVNTVTPEEEGEYALSSVLPQEYRDNSYVVDMGSSNTKISYFDGDEVKGLETYGSKYFKRQVDPEIVYEEVRSTLKEVPEKNRKYCFIIGGVPFKLAKEVREDKERYTTLKAPSYYNNIDDDKVIAGNNIYQAIIDETGTQTYIFDWDSNFSIGFLKTLR